MALTQAFVARFNSAHRARIADDASSIISEGDSSFDTRSCHSEPSSSSPSGTSSVLRARPNEHLAVLLSKRRWKPDSQAAHCDTFLCRKAFSIFERRHHCRKCGGVFCGECSSRTTALLDASNLSFLYPPRNVPIALFNSPTSPVVEARVCDDCWDQIHGSKSPRSPVLTKLSNPIALVRDAESSVSSGSSSPASSSLGTPPDSSPLSSLSSRPGFKRTHTSPRIPASPLRSNTPVPQSIVVAGPLISDSELSLGELDAYPLKRASSICKATGGGRWEPKQLPEYVAKRVPGCKAAYELELEREAAERALRRANPVIKDGDFQLRVPREIEPRSPAGPITLSTF
ncbi:FYVE zinc finger-domain-containing protein [Trametes meyenii]|nr:FYVE zinc finger-domain-containing protein [Trametes meyenii]